MTLLFHTNVFIVFAESTIDELKQSIDNHTEKIKQLDAEIKTYEKQIEKTSSEATTLKNTIQILDVNQKKLGTEIKKTETNIQKTNLVIGELDKKILQTEEKIDSDNKTIGKTLNNIYQNDQDSLVENILNEKSLADVFEEYQNNTAFYESLKNQVVQLTEHKDYLSSQKNTSEKEKKNLTSFKSELNDQNKILTNNKKEKNSLLTATKNKESEYKKILAERQAEKDRFEKELFEYESKLKKAIDPNSFPSSGNIFSWPLNKILITQYFGKTASSKRLYTSGTHNGVDFGISIGNPVKTTMEGTVRGTGNTDEQKGCYSYGKWVLVDHPNGLSTLYAHLSLIKVSAGQKVSNEEIIGYSGNTGYSTGPHLHLTVYATQGIVGIQKYSSSINCKNVSIPIAGTNAYLDPMIYLPK